MAKKMFTEAGLERLRAPANGRVELGDSVVSGLMLHSRRRDPKRAYRPLPPPALLRRIIAVAPPRITGLPVWTALAKEAEPVVVP